MSLLEIRILLRHASAMAGTQVCHPDNCTKQQRIKLWLLVRWAITEEASRGNI